MDCWNLPQHSRPDEAPSVCVPPACTPNPPAQQTGRLPLQRRPPAGWLQPRRHPPAHDPAVAARLAAGGDRRTAGLRRCHRAPLDPPLQRPWSSTPRAERNSAASRSASRYVSIVRTALFSARRCSSKERTRSATLGSAMTGRCHEGRSSQMLLHRCARHRRDRRDQEPQVRR